VLTGLEVEAGRSYYSGSTYSDENFIQVSYNVTELFKNKKSRKSKWFSDKAYELGSVEDRRFEKVRRTNKIVKQIGSSGFSATVSGI